MKHFIFVLLFLLPFVSSSQTNETLFDIPTQNLNLYKLVSIDSNVSPNTVKQFQISTQVTFKEYKQYLADVKKDSSEVFYLSQLPDTAIGTKDVWQKYISDPVYENYPVLGISWRNAMNFCRWKTIKDNTDSIRFIYRLPDCSEWLAAYYYLSEKKTEHDINKNYSDWSINIYDESIYVLEADIEKEPFSNYFEWTYFHTDKDALVLKRKRILGNSYLYQNENVFKNSTYFYANEGAKQLGFRYVKDPVSNLSGSNSSSQGLAAILVKIWGLKKK